MLVKIFPQGTNPPERFLQI